MALGFGPLGSAPLNDLGDVLATVSGVGTGTLSQISGVASGFFGEIVVVVPPRPIAGGSIKVKPSRKVTRARRKKLLPALVEPDPIPPVIGTAAGTLSLISGQASATHGVTGTGAGTVSANISGAALGEFFDSVAADNDLLLLAA